MNPQEISDVEFAFPAQVKHLMPDYASIPEEFKGHSGKWNKLISTWFYRGLNLGKLSPKDGIDSELALRHVGAIMGFFEPKHEHKEAACAYLLSQWFDDIEYTPRKA